MLFSRTTILAIRSLLVLAREDDDRPRSRTFIAGNLCCSPTYLSKTLGLLVRGGVLRAVRGAHGGVRLARPASEVTLLEILETCQGRVVPDCCVEVVPAELVGSVCGFHDAMNELHESVVTTLTGWTLADLAARPTGPRTAGRKCMIDCDRG